ncbi:MAG: MATE family efflux transporter [Eubacteriaceae bacterium]|jgi:putative MATE family efflux protein|nr:MATE family efflux transporter [Eubacteriaceae bacterium]
MVRKLTEGPPFKVIVSFAIPMILGNVFQQFYNIADSIIVGKLIGPSALAAVGNSFAIMVLLTSILFGLCMGAGTVFSRYFGAKQYDELKISISTSFIFIGAVTVAIMALSLLFINPIITFMNVPEEVIAENKIYLQIVFAGMVFVFLWNWAAGLLRALGNSKVPLYFLIFATLLNVVLDLLFIIVFKWGVAGAAIATVVAQGLAAVCCVLYCIKKIEFLEFKIKEIRFDKKIFKLTMNYSILTSVQQSIMNFGILMIQSLVNSFGMQVMAAFAAAVKIDAFAYMPMQDYGNAFSIYVAQNHGAKEEKRIADGMKISFIIVALTGLAISAIIWIFAERFMMLFVSAAETEVIVVGAQYLRIEGAFYFLIGFLFLFYGIYRGLGKVRMSIILTIISLGTRVLLAYALAPRFGLNIIWWSIVIGWALADITGAVYYRKVEKKTTYNNSA